MLRIGDHAVGFINRAPTMSETLVRATEICLVPG